MVRGHDPVPPRRGGAAGLARPWRGRDFIAWLDTGDGQIFIDLVDLPRLDRDYTVFAYVTGGMDLVDQMLDGAKILSVSVK